MKKAETPGDSTFISMQNNYMSVVGMFVKASGREHISIPIAADRHHVALVLEGTDTVQPDSLIAYLDGREFARGEGSQLWSHGDGIGLDNINGGTRFHNGVSRTNNGFAGSWDEVQIYNRALASDEVSQLVASVADTIF